MKIISKINRVLLLFAIITSAFFTHSCTEEIDTSARYTFTGNTVISYLRSHPEYSEYCALLDTVKISDYSTSTLSQLLSARGNYTCFAPTNEAINNFLAHLQDSGVISVASWDAPEFQDVKLLEKTRKDIVHNSLIDNGDASEAYQTTDFSISLGINLAQPNMKNRKLQITKVTGDANSEYAVSGCKISNTNCDIYTINGRIHQVAKVVCPSDATAADYFRNLLEDKNSGPYEHYVYACLLDACNLLPELSQIEDEEYYRLRMIGNLKDIAERSLDGFGKVPGYLPEHRYYGYTLFLENDAWWNSVLQGVDGFTENTKVTDYEPAQIVKIVNSFVTRNKLHLSDAAKDDNYTNENNALNQFVTYHIIPAKLEPNKLVIHFNELFYSYANKGAGTTSVFDYYTTMGKRRLIKTFEPPMVFGRGGKGVVFVNRFSTLDNGRRGKYNEIAVPAGREGRAINTSEVPDLFNAYIYNLNLEDMLGKQQGALYYDENVAQMLASERIRIDASSIFNELITNDIRSNENVIARNQCVGIPISEDYQYLEGCDIGKKSKFYYLPGRISSSGDYCWKNYQGDEFNIQGQYEITIKLPPVPRDGMYELRIGLNVNSQRGMCQVYWGTDKEQLPAAGIPIDMRMGGKTWYNKFGQHGVGDPGIVGWEDDVSGDDIVNAENDKKLRNNGYMKAPYSYWLQSSSATDLSKQIMRRQVDALRRIVLRENMKADETYYIQFKSVLSNEGTEFYLDYIEFCEKDVYDNPLVPEDIW